MVNFREKAVALIVDDDEEMRHIVEHYVDRMGYETCTAVSAEAALEMIEAAQPHLLITDALMPRTDGRELCKQIKLRYPRVKVVVMTSLYKAARYKSEAYRVFHADGYITKPIDFAELRNVLQRLVPVHQGHPAGERQ